MPARRLTALGLFALAAACDRAMPLSPIGPASPTVTALTIAGADAVLTGVSTNYTAAATMSDGSTRTITPVWTTSNPAVASVDGAGRTEGLAHGATTLSATYQERSVSKTVQVVNDYGGTWEGRYVTACRDTGELAYLDGGWCLAGPGRVGSGGGILLRVVQSGKDLSDITATFASYRGTLKGLVSSDGRLTLSGLLTVEDAPYNWPSLTLATVQVGPWNTTLDRTHVMAGRWAAVYTSLVGNKGTAHTEHELLTMTRVSTSVLRAPPIRR